LAETSKKVNLQSPEDNSSKKISGKIYTSVSQLMPDHWQCKKHDKGLLKAVGKHGFGFV